MKLSRFLRGELLLNMRIIGLISSLFFAQLLCAQNLVPNPSFENYDSCPKYNGDLFCTPWYNPTDNTPDYLNACWNGSWPDTMDVPINRFGTQGARTGMAYTGIYGLYASANGRDYISVKLLDSLEPGRTYCVEFFVSLADSSWGGINYLGAHLSLTPDTMFAGFSINNLPFQPQIECDTVISDTATWVKIYGEFIAAGGECYLTIGVFKPDSLLTYDSIQGDGSARAAYYFIDDVSVLNCDTPAIEYPTFTLYPNPSGRSFNITGNFPPGAEFCIYNMLGQLVYDPIILPEGNNNVLIDSDLGVGVYYYQIRNAELIAEGKFAVVE